MCCKRGSHCRKRRGPELGIFPKNLAEGSDPRTNRQHRVEVAASDLLVTGSNLDLPEARSFQNAAHAVGVSERERARRIRIVRRLRRQMRGGGPKRQDVERVSSSARQQTKASLPFGFRLQRMLMNAAMGSAKNITPKREKAASNDAGSNGNTWASA